ncbi:hypothetical protein GF324_01160, partial [bacterium]|nr:hypothetical protein [bacterium]
MKRRFHRILSVTAVLLPVLLAACAKMAPPSGGPEDEEPPEILQTSPAEGEVNVDTETPVVIQFSEAVRKPTVSGSFSLSPPPLGDVRGSWKGKNLILTFDPPLLDDRTYVLTLGTQLADMRGVRREQAFHLAFSTGPTLDHGRIEGTLYTPDGSNVQGWLVLGFWTGREGEEQPDSLADPSRFVPDAATQAGVDGSFSMRNLKAGRWRVFAFNDSDKDRLWTRDVETVAVSPRELFVKDDSLAAPEVITLRAAPRVRTPKPRRLSVVRPDLLYVRFDRKPPTLDGSFVVF